MGRGEGGERGGWEDYMRVKALLNKTFLLVLPKRFQNTDKLSY